MALSFIDRLTEAIRRKGNAVLVGLDPRLEWIPPSICEKCRKDTNKWTGSFAEIMGLEEKGDEIPFNDSVDLSPTIYADFCCQIIDIIADYVPCVKPQAAFFEQFGLDGITALSEVIDYAKSRDLIVILDGKRNDIGSTAQAYAAGYLGEKSAWGTDALTVSPYLGDDSLTPFIQTAAAESAGIFVLVKTSNAGGGMLQNQVVYDPQTGKGGRMIYEIVADFVEQQASQTLGNCGYGAVGAVVGATYPKELAELRQRMPHTWFLIPGFGAQGGTAENVRPAFDASGLGAIVNNSRGINFAWRTDAYKSYGVARWKDAVLAATQDMAKLFAVEK